MPNTIAQSLYEATMVGNIFEAAQLKEEIEKRSEALFPKSKTNVINFNTVLNDDNSSSISIYMFLTKEFGDSWWEWETETLERMLWLKFSIALEDVNRDKVFAIRHICRSDQAFWDWHEFNQLALAFSGSLADFEMIRKPSPGMVINAVKTMNFIRPERNSNFGNDTTKYICIVLKDDGIYCPPPSLSFIITKEFSEMISDDIKNIWKDIYNKYESLVNSKSKDIEDSIVDIQARRILSAEAAALSYGS